MKKILYILGATLSLMVISVNARAQFASGSGTSVDPYVIETVAQLKAMGNYTGIENKDIYFALGNDIDMSGEANWTPIGNFNMFPDETNGNLQFYGKFDGRNHAVKNLKIITTTAAGTRRHNVGFFGSMHTVAMVENFRLENTYLETDGNVAGLLCGHCYGSIRNCVVTGTVKGGMETGGVVGSAYGVYPHIPFIMENCYARVVVSSSSGANPAFVGGMAGRAINAQFANCYVLGNVYLPRGGYSGVFVGGFAHPSNGTVPNFIKNCYTAGQVKGLLKVGGISGYNMGGTLVENTYSAARILKMPETSLLPIPSDRDEHGGLVGAMLVSNDVIKNCYYNTTVFPGLGIGVDSYGTRQRNAIGVTTEEMKQASKFRWDFAPATADASWTIWEENSFPYLVSQLTPVTISRATEIRVEGTYNVNDAPEQIAVYDKDLVFAGYATINTAEQTWYIDLAKPMFSGEQVYAVAEHSDHLMTLAPAAFATVAKVLFSEGAGTKASPYIIRTSEHLRNMGLFTGSAYKDIYFQLAADIDLKNETNWQPLGGRDEADFFYSNFNGNNFVIKNVRITQSGNNVGLFSGIASSGVVVNLGMMGQVITGAESVGSICGINKGMVSNCFAMGTVNGTKNVGGICGINEGTIKDTYTVPTVVNTGDNTGGVVGANNTGGTIEMCYALGRVSGVGNAGGFVGYNSGTISQAFSANEVDGSTGSTGGFCGRNDEESISACYYDMQLSGKEDGIRSGKLNGVKGFSTVDMKKKDSFAQWIFPPTVSAKWTIWDGYSYPYFVSQSMPVVVTYADKDMIEGRCSTTSAPDSVVIYKNHEMLGYVVPQSNTSWQFSLAANPVTSLDVVYAVACSEGKARACPVMPAAITNDANLKSLTTNIGNIIPAFDPAVTEYTVLPVANNTLMVRITAAAANATSSVSGTGVYELKDGENRYKIQVKSGDESASKVYTLKIVRKSAEYVKATDASLKSITLGGFAPNPGFTTGNYSYAVTVPYSTTMLTIAAEATHPYATVEGVGEQTLEVGANTFTVTGRAEDGVTTKNYTVVVTRRTQGDVAGSDASLTALSLSSGYLTPSFASDIYSYTASVPYETSEVTVQATRADNAAQINGADCKTLVIGQNKIQVVVTSEDRSETKTYTITITREQATIATISGLNVNGTEINVASGTRFYYAADCGTTEVAVAVEPSAGAGVMIDGISRRSACIALPAEGYRELLVTIISGDGLTRKHYTVVLANAIPASMIVKRWGNVLSLTTNAMANGGYTFRTFQWYRNGEKLDRETKSYMRATDYTEATKYTVYATTVDGMLLTSCPVTIGDQVLAVSPQAYPNPVQAGSELHIEGAAGATKMNMVDISGRVVKTAPMNNDGISSVTAPLQSGIYLLQLMNGSQQLETVKIIVK